MCISLIFTGSQVMQACSCTKTVWIHTLTYSHVHRTLIITPHCPSGLASFHHKKRKFCSWPAQLVTCQQLIHWGFQSLFYFTYLMLVYNPNQYSVLNQVLFLYASITIMHVEATFIKKATFTVIITARAHSSSNKMSSDSYITSSALFCL